MIKQLRIGQFILSMLLFMSSAHGQNLIQNPDCELPLSNTKIPYWTEVLGIRWGVRAVSPAPQNGRQYFFAGVGAEKELAQTVVLTNYVSLITQGNMSFRFTGYVRAYPQNPPDQSQIIIELLDGNEVIVQSHDLGIYNQSLEWKLLEKLFKAPPLTRKIKIRLLSHRKNGSNNDGYFDNLSLTPEPQAGRPQPQENPAISQSIVSGQVFDKKTLKPVKTVLSVIGDHFPQQTVPTQNDGTYSFKAPINDMSIVSIAENNYNPLRESFTVDKPNLIKNFFLAPKSASAEIKHNEPIVLKNVLFKLSTATLLPESFPELDRLASLMQNNSTMKIQLEGHTDRIGNASSNLKLSQDRVKEVKRYLAQKGINETRMTTKGYGDTRTICTPPCEANRRVELLIIEQ